MFVSKQEEIQDACPTSRWRNPQKLTRWIEDEEMGLMAPILGARLMQFLADRYAELNVAYGMITSSAVEQSDKDIPEEDMRTIMVIRHIQTAVINRMLSNKVMTLSTSLNEGGGTNRMSTDGYETSDLDELKAFSSECYHSSMRAIENLLYALEADASSANPLFKEMWSESKYYYVHGELLFPTLRSMLHYYDCCDGPSKFVALTDKIRFCQNTYIAPAIGQDMVELLVKADNEDPTSENHAVRMKALVYTRQALSLFISSRVSKEDRTDLFAAAQMALNTATAYITKNQAFFGDAIKTSPLYIEEKVTSEETPSETAEEEEKPVYHTFSTLGMGLNRW